MCGLQKWTVTYNENAEMEVEKARELLLAIKGVASALTHCDSKPLPTEAGRPQKLGEDVRSRRQV